MVQGGSDSWCGLLPKAWVPQGTCLCDPHKHLMTGVGTYGAPDYES